ncbi:uncharacterized protein LOC122997247 isoform X2 [Thunnus albacares]|uniref:uncharacterized protein LOC122997247 isoform X2 n=1 Tax=Thunnus albacares TaxID=8236 RepID=UPI001CF67C01|nr:uncharacterized protein LOC122997247 isoform X2 [Thunnus albacares]
MIFHTFNNISPQFSINLSATTPLSIKKRDCLRRICTKMDEFKSIKIYANLGTEFTAEDLLNICSPFGYVVRVQKIVKNGLTHGVVTYSNADDAFGAMMKLCGRPDFFVGYLYQEGARETYENKRPESPSEHQCLPQDEFSDMPPPTLPSLLDTLNPPAHSQSVCLRVHNLPKHMNEKYHVLSLLPAYATLVKVRLKKALVMLPDIHKASQLMDFLNGLYTGSRRLCVSFAHAGGETRPPPRAAHRKGHKKHQGLL